MIDYLGLLSLQPRCQQKKKSLSPPQKILIHDQISQYIHSQIDLRFKNWTVDGEGLIFTTFATNMNTESGVLYRVNHLVSPLYASLSITHRIWLTKASNFGCICPKDWFRWLDSNPMEATLMRIDSRPDWIISSRSSDWSLCQRYAKDTSPSLWHLHDQRFFNICVLIYTASAWAYIQRTSRFGLTRVQPERVDKWTR